MLAARHASSFHCIETISNRQLSVAASGSVTDDSGSDVRKELVFASRDPASFPFAIDDVPPARELRRDEAKFEYLYLFRVRALQLKIMHIFVGLY